MPPGALKLLKSLTPTNFTVPAHQPIVAAESITAKNQHTSNALVGVYLASPIGRSPSGAQKRAAKRLARKKRAVDQRLAVAPAGVRGDAPPDSDTTGPYRPPRPSQACSGEATHLGLAYRRSNM
jgi:hypothetical protein